MIDAHPDVTCPPELHLGALCERLQHVHTVLERGDVDEARARTRRVIGKLMDDHARRVGKRLWCEKSVASVDLLDSMFLTFPDARYIFLYRHCLDVVASALDLCGAGLAGGYGFEGFIARSPSNLVDALIDYWVDKVRRALAFEHDHRPQCVRVRYEDLVYEPDRVLTSMFAFLGLPWRAEMLEAVFCDRRQAGPGDPKIMFSTNIDATSVGAGRAIAFKSISADRLRAMNRLLEDLGYHAVDSGWDEKPPAHQRWIAAVAPVTTVAELFEDRVPARLASRPERLVDPGCSLRFEISDSEKAWLVDLGFDPGVSSDNRSASDTVRARGDVFLRIANRQLDLAHALLLRQLRVTGGRRVLEHLRFLLCEG